jgi:cysteine-S-conjugate beta-lyase
MSNASATDLDFDHPPLAWRAHSSRWRKYGDRDVIPLWVADMDFAAPAAVIQALHERVGQGVFGYCSARASLTEGIVEAMDRLYGWRVHPEWIVYLPGAVVGLNVMSRALLAEGEEVLCLTPVYPPFMTAPKVSGRVAREVPLVLDRAAHRWSIDFDALEAAITPRTKMLFLCHPHNPISRVWREDELRRLAELCERHDLYIGSDELHCDLILDPKLRHVPMATIGEAISQRTITLMAPSKTFNLAGLGTTLAIVPDAIARQKIRSAAAYRASNVNALGYIACEAAYRHGEPWRQALLAYLRTNRDLLVSFIAEHFPGISLEAPIEATFLAWLNVASLKLDNPAEFFESHGVGLMDGETFSAPRGHYVRLNFAVPRGMLVEALQRMQTGLISRGISMGAK